MIKRFFLVCFVFVFIGCAAMERREEYIAVRNEIVIVASQVEAILPAATNWCGPENTCQYLRNIKCGGKTEEDCIAALRRDTVKLGGDTVIVQAAREYKGAPGRVLVFAQAYNCKGKFTQLGMRYQVVNPTRLKKVRYLGVDYANKCNIKQKCKLVQPFKCRSFDSNPARKCMGDLDRQFSDDSPVNSLVFEEETFVDEQDYGRFQAGDYLLKGRGYNCRFK